VSKVVLVTGATSGFGREIVRVFAKDGYRVIAIGNGKLPQNSDLFRVLRRFIFYYDRSRVVWNIIIGKY